MVTNLNGEDLYWIKYGKIPGSFCLYNKLYEIKAPLVVAQELSPILLHNRQNNDVNK